MNGELLHEGDILRRTRDWLHEHAGEMAYVFRLHQPKLTGFPNPGSSMWELLVLLDQHPRGVKVKDMLAPLREEEPNLREMIRTYVQRGIILRPDQGRYRLGPHGKFWLDFHRMLGTGGAS